MVDDVIDRHIIISCQIAYSFHVQIYYLYKYTYTLHVRAYIVC